MITKNMEINWISFRRSEIRR